MFGDYFPVKKYVTMENGDRVIRAFGINLFGKERDVGETHIESIEGDRFVDLVSDIDACINVLFTGEKKFRKSNRLSDNLSTLRCISIGHRIQRILI